MLALLWFPRPLLNARSSGRAGVQEATRDAAKEMTYDDVKEGRRRSAAPASDQPRQLDPVGAVQLGVAVLALLLPFVEARASSSGWLWALLPVALVLGLCWVLWEHRYKSSGRSPMVDLAIFKTRSFSVGTLLIGLYFLGITSVWVLVAQYMQEGLGHSALESGTIGLPNAVLSAVTANMAGRRVFRYGRKLVAAGMVSVLAGLGLSVLVIELHAHGTVSEWWLLATLALVGAGQGAVVSPNQTLTLAEVPLQYAGSAGGIMQTAQRVGTSVGIALVTAVAFTVLASSDWAQAITAGFGLIGAVIVSALLVAVRDVR
ncbi:MFS transporter [Arthrobacter sp. A5]|uniref:MFS transporter n=1 Tax=Arthrobacter sp. A5 TaxID=576926 RepID=UPI003DA899CA